MKTQALFVLILAAALSSLAATNSLERFSPPLAATTPIIWRASTRDLPGGFWIYRRLLPHIFPASVISNAFTLASYQNRGIPPPSTNDTCIVDDPDCNCSCGHPCSLFIGPGDATLNFYQPHPDTCTMLIPDDPAVVQLARRHAFDLGVDLAQVVAKNMTSRFNTDTNGDDLTNQICGRGVFLSRQLDGLRFWGTGDNGPSEGLWMEFGCREELRGFAVNWPDLERVQFAPAATAAQIMACIRAHKVIVIPEHGDNQYFQKLRHLAKAKTFTITKINAYYCEGVFGEADGEPSKFINPIAEVEADADFGTSNTIVRLYCPILSVDVRRLTGQ